MPVGILSIKNAIVKPISINNNINNIQEKISINDFLKCIEIVIRHIVSQNKKESKNKLIKKSEA